MFATYDELMNAHIEREDLKKFPITYKNFSGREGEMNKEGDRNFSIVLDKDTAQYLADRGWYIKVQEPKEGEDAQYRYLLKVRISYKFYEPTIIKVSDRCKKRVHEKDINDLDQLHIKNVSVRISPSKWKKGSNFGVAAYVDRMYVEYEEDNFDDDYINIPDGDFGSEDNLVE